MTLAPGPWRRQAILGRGRWDADALRDIVRGGAAIYGFGGQDYELPDVVRARLASDGRRVHLLRVAERPCLRGWHRHVSLVMPAFTMLATSRHHLNRQTPQKTLQYQNGTAPDPTRPHHRVANLATRPSGSRKRRSRQKKCASVMVGFHDTVLKNGHLPQTILQEQVGAWSKV